MTLCIENRGELESSKVENNQEKLEMLDRFIKKASLAREVGYWSPKDPGKNISTIACIAISRLKDNAPAIGWIRADSERSQSIQGALCGNWSLKHIDGNITYEDTMEITEQDNNKISGKIKRTKKMKGFKNPRNWECFGIKIESVIASVYYSEKDDSIGCSLLHLVDKKQYKGKYLRYNISRSDIDLIDGVEMIDSEIYKVGKNRTNQKPNKK